MWGAGLCTQVGLELSPGSECELVSRRKGTAGTRALRHWGRKRGQGKWGASVCTDVWDGA